MSSYHTIIAELRHRGYRITPQREMIIRIITHGRGHLSAEEVYEELQKHTSAINIATIYRTLDLLWSEGFACRNDLGGGKILYAATKHGPHIHLVCRCCNAVIETDPQVLTQLGEILLSRNGFKADLKHLSFFGECAECQNNIQRKEG